MNHCKYWKVCQIDFKLFLLQMPAVRISYSCSNSGTRSAHLYQYSQSVTKVILWKTILQHMTLVKKFLHYRSTPSTHYAEVRSRSCKKATGMNVKLDDAVGQSLALALHFSSSDFVFFNP